MPKLESSINEYPIENGSKLISFFEEHKNLNTVLKSALKEKMGLIFVDDVENPTVALLSYNVLNFVAGDSSSQITKDLLNTIPYHKMILTPNEGWVRLLRDQWGNKLIELGSGRTRFSSKSLNLDHIRSLKKGLPKNYQIAPISLENALLFDKLMVEYIFSFFGTHNEFLERGFGFCIRNGDVIICAAATSHPPFENAFEVQIVTKKEYRRQGLATIAAAYLIEYSLENGYDPRWDADNAKSVILAEKMGYSEPEPYKYYIYAKLPLVILRKLKIMNFIGFILKILGKYPD